jgi:zinc transport system ATP-binding protein
MPPEPTGQHVEAPAIELRDVSYTYPRTPMGGAPAAPAVEGVSLTVERGERLGILGPNGGGKSTLLKLIIGLIRGASGTIRVLGRSPGEARRLGLIGYVPQRVGAELEFPLSVRQVVAMGASVGISPWRRMPPDRAERVDRSIDLVGAGAFRERAIGKLSGGQLQRVMIARALACDPKILVLDEPTVGIDVEGQRRFAALIERLSEKLALTIVIVSHDLRTVATGCDRVACLSRTLHYHAAPGGLTPAVLAEVFSHDIEGVFGAVHIDAHRAEDCPDPERHHPHACDAHDHDHGGAS